MIFILFAVLIESCISVSHLNMKYHDLPKWLRDRSRGEYKITPPKCDILNDSLPFYPFYRDDIKPLAHSGWFYLSPKNLDQRLQKEKIKIVHYASNLRRALDTWLFSYFPINAKNLVMTSDLQELTDHKDGSINDLERPEGRPLFSKQQKQTWKKLTKDSYLLITNKQKKEAFEKARKRISKFYQLLNLHKRHKERQDWNKDYDQDKDPEHPKSVENSIQKYFIEDLEEECKKGTMVVNATAHSMFWKRFIEKHSSSSSSCGESGKNRLNNGAVISMIVRFNKDCKAFSPDGISKPIVSCKLIFGSLLYENPNDEPKKCCKIESTDEERFAETIEGMKVQDRQILLLAERHGRSYFNEAWEKYNGKGELFEKESQITDSDLTPEGINDAIRLNNRLNYPENSKDKCSMCPKEKECLDKLRLCSFIYTGKSLDHAVSVIFK